MHTMACCQCSHQFNKSLLNGTTPQRPTMQQSHAANLCKLLQNQLPNNKVGTTDLRLERGSSPCFIVCRYFKQRQSLKCFFIAVACLKIWTLVPRHNLRAKMQLFRICLMFFIAQKMRTTTNVTKIGNDGQLNKASLQP